ncbi:hypothetical protein ACIB24_08590 [Spongisporangium articulatum]|uniref:Uncharacterized protein n=1 Tax=Spongisporangium articulatum TaxID=3362603 RepID=A0ABW8AL90_9ACTN
MTTDPGSPIDRLLNAFLVIAPLAYLLTDVLYALRGWDDATAGAVHVVAATAYALVLLRFVTWSDDDRAAALLLAVGTVGAAGNVAYGFNTIHVSLGDTDLVDATGAANLIKPWGLAFPATFLLAAWALRRVAPPWARALLVVAGIAWPVAHIANVAWLAVAVNVVLVVACLELGRSVQVGTTSPRTAVTV